MTEWSDVRDRIVGALTGLVVGDALGAPVEFMDRQSIAEAFPLGIRDYVDRPSTGLRPGQGTDDTEMALLVASSLVEKQALDMQDISARLVMWGEHHVGLGPSTGAGIAALAQGVQWHEAGQTVVASSGCLPRCAPVALVASPSQLIADTIRCCKPTHRHPLALAAVVAQNLILERLIRGMSWPEARSDLLDNLHHIPELAAIGPALNGDTPVPGAVSVLVEALHCLDDADDAESAIMASVTMGGDTDTRAAVAGAFAGARWGLSGIPQRWIDVCEVHNQAIELGGALAQLHLIADQRGA